MKLNNLLAIFLTLGLVTGCNQESGEQDEAEQPQEQVEKAAAPEATKQGDDTSTAAAPLQSGQNGTATNVVGAAKPILKGQPKMIAMKGRVVFNRIEGGFYGIITADGQRYLPLNLAKEFRQDGLPIEFTGQVKTDVMTTAQWGVPFMLGHVKPLGEVKKSGPEI